MLSFILLLQTIPHDTDTEPLRFITLQIGTPIPLVILDRISTKTCRKGDLFRMQVSEDVLWEKRIVLPKGTPAFGELTKCETKGAFGRSRKLEGRTLYLKLNDRTVRLTGDLAAKGKGGTSETILATAAIGLTSFLVTGRSAIVEAGTEVHAILDRDTNIPVPGASKETVDQNR